jgi:2-keto-4-pentenoate hydratase/2-oxohepta-3-ene-1,7-dioic acid hydratase in catechol pathway
VLNGIELGAPTLDLGDVTLLPVIPDPEKIFCIGVNYHSHREEMSRDHADHPTIFTRFANTQVAHGAPLLCPPESDQFDYEGEIAIIIGKSGRRIARADAWDHVAGYAPYCDATLRDWQRHGTAQQWTPGKNFVGTGGFGPWMVTRDEIPDNSDLGLETWLNGAQVQATSMGLMIFDVPAIIAYCSTFTLLEPGDVIATGTPGGVGIKRNPPLWMKPGDRVEVRVEKVGTLSHPIAAETLA